MRISEELSSRLSVLLVAPAMLIASAIMIDSGSSPLKGRQMHFEESTKASRSYSESSAKLLHDGLSAEHGGALHLNGAPAEELELERVRLHRRQNYSSLK